MSLFITRRAASITGSRKKKALTGHFFLLQGEIFFSSSHNVHLCLPAGRFINSKSKKKLCFHSDCSGSIMESVFRCYQDNNSAMAHERGTQLARRGERTISP